MMRMMMMMMMIRLAVIQEEIFKNITYKRVKLQQRLHQNRKWEETVVCHQRKCGDLRQEMKSENWGGSTHYEK